MFPPILEQSFRPSILRPPIVVFSASDPWNHPFRDIAASGRVARPPRPEKKKKLRRHAGSTHEMLINFLDSVVEQLIIRYKA